MSEVGVLGPLFVMNCLIKVSGEYKTPCHRWSTINTALGSPSSPIYVTV